MDYFIGISGGHTQSHAILLSGTEVAACAIGESLNCHSLRDEFAGNACVRRLLANLAAATHQSKFDLMKATEGVALSLPGLLTPDDEGYARTCVGSDSWPPHTSIKILDDTWAGLIAGAADPEGICAVAGTGASVFLGTGDFPLGKKRKFDGLGPVIGDWGSGFRLMSRYLENIGREFDRGADSLPLFERLCDKLPKATSVVLIQQWFDNLRLINPASWVSMFARMASIITDAAEEDDQYALALVQESAAQMAETIGCAIAQAESVLSEQHARTLSIVCTGGQFFHSPTYCNTVRASVKKYHPTNPFYFSPFRPVVGAALAACATTGFVPDLTMRNDVLRSIYSSDRAEENGVVVKRDHLASFELELPEPLPVVSED